MMFEGVRKFLFGKRRGPPAVEDLRPTDDWVVGDMAECIRTARWCLLVTPSIAVPGQQNSEILIVRQIDGIDGSLWLGFAKYKGRFCAKYFRKITPKADAAKRSDSSFIDLVRRRTKPAAQPHEMTPPDAKPEPQREDA